MNSPENSHALLAQLKTLKEFKNIPLVYSNHLENKLNLEKAKEKNKNIEYLKGETDGR